MQAGKKTPRNGSATISPQRSAKGSGGESGGSSVRAGHSSCPPPLSANRRSTRDAAREVQALSTSSFEFTPKRHRRHYETFVAVQPHLFAPNEMKVPR